jgi:ribosomal protein S27E
MSEQTKVKCNCGRTIAMQDDNTVYIKCTGKNRETCKKCGEIIKIPKR